MDSTRILRTASSPEGISKLRKENEIMIADNKLLPPILRTMNPKAEYIQKHLLMDGNMLFCNTAGGVNTGKIVDFDICRA
jgi:hypothetical protein